MRRRATKVCAIAVSISVFTATAFAAEAIEIPGSKSSKDLGQTLPNLQISLASGAGNQPVISIRGIGLNSPRGERLRQRFDRIQGSCLQRRLLSATRPKPVSNWGRSDPLRCWLMRPT
jgi:hypothetical protein